MDKKDILNRVIDSGGMCCAQRWEDKFPFAMCPLFSRDKRADGSNVGCFGSIVGDGINLDKQDIDALYVAAAHDMLNSMLLEEIILDEADKKR